MVGVRRRTNKNIVINSRLNVAAKTNKDGRTMKQKYKHLNCPKAFYREIGNSRTRMREGGEKGDYV